MEKNRSWPRRDPDPQLPPNADWVYRPADGLQWPGETNGWRRRRKNRQRTNASSAAWSGGLVGVV